MKKIFLAVLIAASSLNVFASDPGVDEKILDAFNKAFKGAQNVSWSTSEFTYEVRFNLNRVISKITYDKQGNILKTLRYYYEDQLPIIVVTKVKNKFPNKKIYGVVEESSEAGIYYHITLEDEKTWMNIVSDTTGSITVEKKFKKA